MTLQQNIIEVQLNQRYHRAKESLASIQAEITNIEQLAVKNNVTLQTLTEDDLLVMESVEVRDKMKKRKEDEVKHKKDIEDQIKAEEEEKKGKEKGGPK
jgi:predicted amino acid-binding ACT domain protein